MNFRNKMFWYVIYLVVLQSVYSQMSSETSTSRLRQRLDRLEENVSRIQNDVILDLRTELRNLRMDLKGEMDFIKEDISALSARLTGSSGQVVRHDEEHVSKTQHGSCDCGAIVSQYDNLMIAFKREKSGNIMIQREFQEMRQQHDLEIGNISSKFNNMDSRLITAEKTLRSKIDTYKYETVAKFQEMRKHQDFEIANVSEKCSKVESRLNSAEKTLRSDIDTIKKETMAVNQRYATHQKDINTLRAYFNDGLMHLNKSLTNLSLNTLKETPRITSESANLKTSNEVLKNTTDNSIRHLNRPQSCDSVVKSGEYTIYPEAYLQGMNVYCDVDYTNKGWIVVQRRKDGSVDFNRTWADYKAGFGDLSGEFWLGNEHIYQLAKDKPRQLRIDMEGFDGRKAHALYSEFNISSESERYKLHVAGYTGDAGNCLLTARVGSSYGYVHNGQSFSTFDRDNDLRTDCCACEFGGGGWWYEECFNANLNGKYFKERDSVPSWQGVNWFTFTGQTTSLKFVQMSIRLECTLRR